MARIIKTDGTIVPLPPSEPSQERPGKLVLGLDAMQQAVGGSIEIVYNGDGVPWGVCNEEGKLIPLPVNHYATQLWYRACGFEHGDFLAGDIVILDDPSEIE